MPITTARGLRTIALCLTIAACDRASGDDTTDTSHGADTGVNAQRTAADSAALGAVAVCSLPAAPTGTRVLVFSRTAGYRHESIPSGTAAVRALGAKHGFAVDATEDAARFTDAGLRAFRVIVFLNTTGDVLDAAQQAAMERWLKAGGGFVGVHSAADTEYDWPWYGRLVGGWFRSHPAIAQASVNVVDRGHVSTRCLPARWTRTDEWYDYRARPAADVTVLATLDETTYEGATMGAPHPIAWYHPFDGGRAWYTGGGHTIESWTEAPYLSHVAGGILWAAGVAR